MGGGVTQMWWWCDCVQLKVAGQDASGGAATLGAAAAEPAVPRVMLTVALHPHPWRPPLPPPRPLPAARRGETPATVESAALCTLPPAFTPSTCRCRRAYHSVSILTHDPFDQVKHHMCTSTNVLDRHGVPRQAADQRISPSLF